MLDAEVVLLALLLFAGLEAVVHGFDLLHGGGR